MITTLKDAVFHAAETRGAADYGWLKARYSFSFSGYYHPERPGFGALHVLNDDIVAPGHGFGTHPHDNMEIVTVPLFGALEHRDSTGMRDIIRFGDVQIMSAGTGVFHSEMNPDAAVEARLLQIWIRPEKMNIPPRYERKRFDAEQRRNRLLTVVAPNDPDALWINPNAFLSLAELSPDTEPTYFLHAPENGAYFFVVEGQSEIEGQKLKSRDALGLWNRTEITVRAHVPTQILVIEAPMI
jgi:redox-sensitive bicupin YhaK (pirin superfamily)